METERRRDSRFMVREDVFVAFREGFSMIGKVKDIGRGGLSFEHTYENFTGGIQKAHITLWVDEFRMSDVPCRVVYNVPLSAPEEYSHLLICLVTRRCGVQFETLSEDQRAQLDFFLKTHTQENPPSGDISEG